MSEEMTPAVSEPSATWIGNDGKFGDLTSAPESVRGVLEGSKFDSVESLANGYANLRKEFSQNLRIPDKLTDEQITEIRSRINQVPESYELEGIELGDFSETLFESAKQLGLSNDQLKDLVGLQGKYAEYINSEFAQQNELQMQQIREQLGNKKFDDITSKVADYVDKSEVSDMIKAYGLQDNPAFIVAVGEILNRMGEDSIPQSKTEVSKTADEQMKEIMSNPALMDRSHPEHKEVMRKWNDLHLAMNR